MSCSTEMIDSNELEINGNPEAEEFVIYGVDNNNNPFSKYIQEHQLMDYEYYQKEDIKSEKTIKINGNKYKMFYKESYEIVSGVFDVYTCNDITFQYYSDTDILSSIKAGTDGDLCSIFEECNFDSEEEYKKYCEDILKKMNFDISDLNYRCTTTINKTVPYRDRVTYDDYREAQEGEEISSRIFSWVKIYDNGYCGNVVSLTFDSNNDSFLKFSRINFCPVFPDEVFQPIESEIYDMLAKGLAPYNHIEIEDVSYTVVLTDKLAIFVSFFYGMDEVSAGSAAYIFPSDVTFP